MTNNKCLYRCWEQEGKKMQACYPHNSGFCDDIIKDADAKGLKEITEPLGQNPKKYQIINCKYPECI